MKKKHLLNFLTFIFIIFSVKPQLIDESVYLSSLNNYTNPLDKVRKEKVYKALKSLPKREAIDELKMALTMKNAKQEYSLTEAESVYLIYKWITENIKFDLSFIKRDDETSSYNNGSGSYYGISHIFITMCKFLGLKAKYIEGYGLKRHYINSEKILAKYDYGWNSVIIDNKYYLVDSMTFGNFSPFGNYIEDIDIFFCTYPEFFVRTHFPLDNKWQLLRETIDLETFLSQVTLFYFFFKYGFKSIKPDKAFLNVTNTLKIVLINENPNNMLHYLISSNQIGIYLYSNIKEKTEIDFIFNEKRKYIFSLGTSFNEYGSYEIAEYVVNNEMEKNPPLYFPEQYNLINGIKLIEPLYSPLKRGETINFKILFEASDKLFIKDRIGNITLTKEGNIFTGKYFIHDIEGNYISIRYFKDGHTNSLFYYNTY